MTPRRVQPSHPGLWALARRQHGVVTHEQLAALGFTEDAIRHRVAAGRLHRLWPRVYAVGRPEIAQAGRWLAAVRTCGPGTLLSHQSAAELWGIRHAERGPIEVSIPYARSRRRVGMLVHRRVALEQLEIAEHRAIPVTGAVVTLIDIAPRLQAGDLARAVREADKLGLVGPDELREGVSRHCRLAGAGVLRRFLHHESFTLTDSELERRFLPLAEEAGLARPLTQTAVNGVRVDFFFAEIGLVVETDGLRYHRTPSQQAADLERDQLHAAAGLTPLRFTHGQVVHDPEYVVRTLRRVAEHVRRRTIERSAAS